MPTSTLYRLMPARPPVHKPHGYRTEKQRRTENDERRGSASSRGYDRTWQKLRLAFLRLNPICIWCKERGLIVPATVADHIKTIAMHPELRLDTDNLRALCKPCHDAHTAKEQGFAKPIIH